MRQLYNNIYQFLLTASLFIGGVYFFSGCSSYEDDMIGSFPFLEITLKDTSISNTVQEIVIPVNTNREWTASIKYLNGDNTKWIKTTPSKDYKTITLSIQENTTDKKRSASISVKNKSNEETVSFTVEQDMASERTYEGLLVFRDQKDLDNNTYTHVNGSVLVGNVYSEDYVPESKATGSTVKIQIGDKEYTVGSSTISNLSKLSKIISISENALYVINTEVREIPADIFNTFGLEKLYLDWNEIDEIDNLQTLLTVKELSISNNHIEDIKLLSALENIEQLNIAGNQIKNVSILSDMQQITHLTLGESTDETNRIMDISVLNRLPLLKYVSFNGLPIDETQINELNLPDACITVKEDLKGSLLPKVTTSEPVFSNNQLLLSGSLEDQGQGITIDSYGFYYGTTKVLENMTFKQATVNGNEFSTTLSDIDEGTLYYIYAAVKTSEGTVLGGLKRFGEKIFLGNFFIKGNDDIKRFQNDGYSSIIGSIIIGSSSTIYSMGSIPVEIDNTTYYFSKNSEITEISFLSDINKIAGGVYIVNTEVSNLIPLTQIDTIPTIWLAKNQIESIPDLSSIQGLTTLNVSMNQIESVENISLLSGLTSLYLGDKNYLEEEMNKIQDITSLHELLNLSILDISGLAINSQSIKNLRRALPECTVYAEGMAAPQAVVFGRL